MELLLIEDEVTVGEFLKESLNKEGYQITWCKNKSEVDGFLLSNILSFDIVILDRMLAGEDAASLIPVLKKSGPKLKYSYYLLSIFRKRKPACLISAPTNIWPNLFRWLN